MDKKDFCGELLAGRRMRGDDGHLPQACGPGDLANPGAGKWRRDHVHSLSPRSGGLSVAVHRRGGGTAKLHDAFLCE